MQAAARCICLTAPCVHGRLLCTVLHALAVCTRCPICPTTPHGCTAYIAAPSSPSVPRVSFLWLHCMPRCPLHHASVHGCTACPDAHCTTPVSMAALHALVAPDTPLHHGTATHVHGCTVCPRPHLPHCTIAHVPWLHCML
jgi:hypothetical protein